VDLTRRCYYLLAPLFDATVLRSASSYPTNSQVHIFFKKRIFFCNTRFADGPIVAPFGFDFGKLLILDNDFLSLSLQQRIFFQRMLNGIMKNDSPSLDYCKKILRCDQYASTQFIDILTEKIENDIMVLLLNTT